jgi:hypothetical protein
LAHREQDFAAYVTSGWPLPARQCRDDAMTQSRFEYKAL